MQLKKRTITEPLGRLSWEGQKSALRRPKQATFPLNIDTGFIVNAPVTSHFAALGYILYVINLAISIILLSQNHRVYILRAAVLLVTGALTINPESIFSGNIAWFGLQQGCSAETEPFFDLLSLALPKWLSFGPFFKLQFNEVKLTNHFL